MTPTRKQYAAIMNAIEQSMRDDLTYPASIAFPGEPISRVWIETTWDAGFETLAALSPHEYAGTRLPDTERSVVLDLWWSSNDGYLKSALRADGQIVASRHLDCTTATTLTAAWERLFHFPYNGELDHA